MHKYKRNTIANLVGNFILAGMMFFVTPILIRLLGDDQYGLFRVAMVSVISYAALLDMGLNNAVRRFFSEALHCNNIEQANNVLGIAYRLYFFISAFVLVGIIILLWWLPSWVKAPMELIWPFRWLLLAAGVYIAGQFLFCPFQSIFIAFGRYDLLQISTVIVRVLLFACGIVLLIFWHNSLTSLAAAALIAVILTFLLTFFLARHIFPAMAVSWGYRERELQKKMFSFGGYGLMIAIGPVVVYQTQDALISGFLGPAQVTTYAAAAIIMTQIRAVINAFASPLFPIASKLKAQSNKTAIQNLLLDGTRRCLWVWGAIAGPLIVFAGDFIAAWIGPQFSWTQVLVWILLIGNFGTAMQSCAGHILTAVGSIKWLGYTMLIMSIGLIAGMIIILGITHYGLVGLAWVISIAIAIRSGILVPIYACLQLDISIKKYLLTVIIPIVIFLIFSTGISWQIFRWFHPQNLFSISTTLLILVLINMTIGMFITFSHSKMRKLFLRYLTARNDL